MIMMMENDDYHLDYYLQRWFICRPFAHNFLSTVVTSTYEGNFFKGETMESGKSFEIQSEFPAFDGDGSFE